MASDTQNVKLGVCKVLYNGVDLGYTKGGVEVEVATSTHAVMVDQFGETEVNEYIMGRTVKVRCPLAETTLANLVAIMPGATLVTDAVDPTSMRVDVVNSVGTDLLSIAQALTLHPIALLDADVSEDFTVHKAATAGALQFAYKLDEERIFNCEFTGYPDITASGKLFSIGDLTATPA